MSRIIPTWAGLPDKPTIGNIAGVLPIDKLPSHAHLWSDLPGFLPLDKLPLHNHDSSYYTKPQVDAAIGGIDLSGRVPYTGATGSVNLGVHGLTAGPVECSNLTASGNVSPTANGTQNLGSTTNYWGTLHVGSIRTGGALNLNTNGTSYGLISSGSNGFWDTDSFTFRSALGVNRASIISTGLQFSSGNTISTTAGTLTLAPFNGQIWLGTVGAAGMRSATEFGLASNASINFTNAASNFYIATIDAKLSRYGASTLTFSNAAGTAGFIARADNGRYLLGYDSGGDYIQAGNGVGAAVPLFIGNNNTSIRFSSGTERMRIVAASGNILIGSTTDDGVTRLQVTGSLKATSGIGAWGTTPPTVKPTLPTNPTNAEIASLLSSYGLCTLV